MKLHKTNCPCYDGKSKEGDTCTSPTDTPEKEECCEECKCPNDCDQPGEHCQIIKNGKPDCSCHKSPKEVEPIPEEWEIEFENEFAHWWGCKSLLTERIKDHIKSLLAKELRGSLTRSEVVRLVAEKESIARTEAVAKMNNSGKALYEAGRKDMAEECIEIVRQGGEVRNKLEALLNRTK